MSPFAKAFRTHSGLAAPLPIDNVDTDQIIPSREMRRVGRDGLGLGLFAGWRYIEANERVPDPAFILNREGFQRASILIAGENFGCGSSREHAVWALAEFGFRVIIAKGFGDIFFNNCLRNGLLPVVLPAAEVDRLLEAARRAPVSLTVSLLDQTVRRDGVEGALSFAIDPFQRRLLVEGLDPIGLTLKEKAQINAHIERDKAVRPWLYREPEAN